MNKGVGRRVPDERNRLRPHSVEKRLELSWQYRAFSRQEHTRRISEARGLMEAEKLSACICTSPELIYYFTGYEAHTHHAIGSQAMVLGIDQDEPILILRDGDVPQADETLTVGELRSFRLGAVDLADLLAATLSEIGLTGSPVGVDLSGPTTTGALALAIRAAIGQEVRDCWRMLGRLRTVLSQPEIAYVKQAAGYANVGIDAFFERVRAGMSEIELAAEIEHAMRSQGSDYPAVPTWMASGERQHCQHAMASPRLLRPGDLVHAEFAGVARRYHCVTMGSLVLGEPTTRMRELAEGGVTAYEAGLSEARPGGRIGDMEASYRRALEEAGLGDCGIMRFGTGLSAAYPPVWENQITIQYETDDLLEPGVAFYVHASLQSLEDRTGMLIGGSYLMTGNGPERLDRAPLDLVVLEE